MVTEGTTKVLNHTFRILTVLSVVIVKNVMNEWCKDRTWNKHSVNDRSCYNIKSLIFHQFYM